MKKFLKIFGVIIGSLILLYVIACFIGPSEMKTTRSISINAPASEVYEQVANFSNWSKWSMWSQRDKNMQSTFEGDPMMVNHKWTWKSTEGNGSEIITSVIPNQEIKTDLLFEGFEDPNRSTFTFKESGFIDGSVPCTTCITEVAWTMDMGKIPFMFRGMMFMFQGRLIEDFDGGLANLKKVCES
ncbi:MAG: hypothetical protein RL664_1894 [Bacteroidota bacterium]